MRIELTSDEAMHLLDYPHASKPLPECRRSDNPQNPTWWITSPKTERIHTDRHGAAMRLYLALAARSSEQLAEGRFPALFRCRDGVARRPDKGFIKACLEPANGFLAPRHDSERNELFFELTDRGRMWLRRLDSAGR